MAAASVPAAAVPAATPAPPAGPDPRFAALAAKETALRAERESLAKDKAELADWKRTRDNALRDPEAYLKPVYGDDYIKTLNEFALNGKTLTPELVDKRVEQRFSQLEQQKLEAQKQADAERKAGEAQAIQEFNASAVAYVKQHASKYEFIEANDSYDLVPKVIEKHYAETQKVLSFEEAADLVEKHIEEQVERNTKTKKWAARSAAPAAGGKPAPSMGGMNGTSVGSEKVGLSEAERMQRAIAVATQYEERAKARAAQGA